MGAAAWGAIAAGTSAAVGVYSADQSRQNSNRAADNAAAQASEQEQQFNKVNGKQPDVTAMTDQNTQAGKNGPSGTLLTGPQGVDPSKLTLGRATLLGGAPTPAPTLGG
jgi:type II secretory pathway pseudopilin PulG